MRQPWSVFRSERPVNNARGRWRFRVPGLEPGLGRAGAIWRSELLRHDAFKPKLTDGIEYSVAVAFGVFHILDAPARPTKHPPQCVLALNQRPPPKIITRKKKIESTGHSFLIGGAAVQGIEIRNAFGIETDNFGINNQGLTEPSRFLDNAWIALSPIRAVHGVEPHSSVADVDLQPIAIVF